MYGNMRIIGYVGDGFIVCTSCYSGMMADDASEAMEPLHTEDQCEHCDECHQPIGGDCWCESDENTTEEDDPSEEDDVGEDNDPMVIGGV